MLPGESKVCSQVAVFTPNQRPSAGRKVWVTSTVTWVAQALHG